MKIVKIAVIGLGYWGPNLVRNFFNLDKVEVVYGCDLDSNRFASLSKQYPAVTWVTDCEQIFQDSSVDAVVIATSVNTHFSLAERALKANKHVLLEKPMTKTSEEAVALIEMAKNKNLVLAVDHTFLFTGAVRKIKELVDKRELGDIHYFDSERINLGLIQSDINVIWDLAPHDISIMNYIFGNDLPVRVYASGTHHVTKNKEEVAHIMVTFKSGAVGHIHVSWIAPVKIRKILVGGSKKMVLYNDIAPDEKVKVYDRGAEIETSKITPFKPVYRSGDIYVPKLSQVEALGLVAQDFIECIRGKETSIISGEEGLKVIRILEACDRSLLTGAPINL